MRDNLDINNRFDIGRAFQHIGDLILSVMEGPTKNDTYGKLILALLAGGLVALAETLALLPLTIFAYACFVIAVAALTNGGKGVS
jgi:hypothetical protein